jgi:hypothetical protein
MEQRDALLAFREGRSRWSLDDGVANAFSRRSSKHPLTLIVEVADTAAHFRTASRALKPRSSKP